MTLGGAEGEAAMLMGAEGEAAMLMDSSEAGFDMFVVLDLEATCEASGQRTAVQEVIEMPSVLLDARTGAVLDEFQQYHSP